MMRRVAVAAMMAGLAAAPVAAQTVLHAVGAENEYADVLAQIGKPYVAVSAIESDPNTDPHEFEVSPKVAAALAGANVVVENGAGYDSWADPLLSGSKAIILNAQRLRGLPDDIANPHLWYDPATMPVVARAIAAAYARLDPAHAATYQENASAFIASLKPWTDLIAELRATYAGTKVAVTEPVADYLLQAVGLDIATPYTLQAAIMNGTDPAPQDVATQDDLLNGQKVQVFVHNAQVTDPVTENFLALAQNNNIRVVAAFETMPLKATYQSWMLGETKALAQALAASGH
jgi:zinc/manganese transport system substrate-binding protein